MKKRTVIGMLALAIVTLAGCQRITGADNTTPTAVPTATSTPTPTPTMTPRRELRTVVM